MEIVDRLELRIDYNDPLSQLLKAAALDEGHAGRFLPEPRPGFVWVLNAHLVQFRTWIQTPEALVAMAAKDLRPGNYQELLALAAQYPTMQYFGPIVELGSHYLDDGGREVVVFLGYQGNKRVMDWDHLEGGPNGWGTQTRFLAFPKTK